MTVRKILLLNGPNLDMLGIREPEVYGRDTLGTLEHTVRMYAEQHNVELTCYQSNNEGKLIDRIHGAQGKFDGIVYNPGAHTHYSYALRDAVGSIDVPVVEVHLSAIETREAFRHISVIAPACVAQVKGLGIGGYCRAIDILLDNAFLPRLGEGYESRFPVSKNIVIAGQEPISEDAQAEPQSIPQEGDGLPLQQGEGGPESEEGGSHVAPQRSEGHLSMGVHSGVLFPLSERGRAEELPKDFTAPFASSIQATDFGMISFERQQLVRAACDQLGIDALLVRDTSNIRWITAFDGVFDEECAHGLLLARDRTTLHTDSRYANALRMAAATANSDIIVNDDRTNHLQFAYNALAMGAHDAFEGKLGIEDTITYAEFVQAAEVFGTPRLTPTTDIVLNLRAVKDAAEIQRLRAAQAVTDAAFEHIVGFMRPGMTEREVQLELEDFMLRHGADGLAFRSIVATGENGADPHAVPSGKRLEAGQCVVMDFGATAFGYCSDMTRVVFLGAPEGKMARAWEVLRQANETVERMLIPGVTGKEAHETAERVLAEGGFEGKMGHGLGHGVGIDCHELPVLNSRNDQPLREGNVVTVEPGIYLPGEFGMRLEDCGVITATGYDAFSRLGHEMVVI